MKSVEISRSYCCHCDLYFLFLFFTDLVISLFNKYPTKTSPSHGRHLAFDPPYFYPLPCLFSPPSLQFSVRVCRSGQADPPQRCGGGEPPGNPKVLPASFPSFIPSPGPVFRRHLQGPRLGVHRSGNGGWRRWLPQEMIGRLGSDALRLTRSRVVLCLGEL